MKTHLSKGNGTFKMVLLKNGTNLSTQDGICPHCGDECSMHSSKTITWTHSSSLMNGPLGAATHGFDLTQCNSCKNWSIDTQSIYKGVPTHLLAIHLTKTPKEIESFLK